MEIFSTVIAFLGEIWALLATVGAGVGSFYLGYRRFKREEKTSVNDRLDKLYAQIEKERTELKDENNRLRDKMITLQDGQTQLLIEYTEMKTKWETIVGSDHKDLSIESLIEFGIRQKRLSQTLEEFTKTFPGILWMKEVEKKRDGNPKDFRVFAISQTYADTYLNGDPSVYVGKTDSNVWDAKTAKIFRENDTEAYNSRLAVKIIEPLLNKQNGKTGIFVGWKWNLSVEGIDYVCGYGDHHDPGTEGHDFWKKLYEEKMADKKSAVVRRKPISSKQLYTVHGGVENDSDNGRNPD